MNFQTTADRIRSNAPTSSLMAKLPDHFEALIHKDIKPIGWKQTEDQVKAMNAMQARDDALEEAKANKIREMKRRQILRKLEHRTQIAKAKYNSLAAETPTVPEPEDGQAYAFLVHPMRCRRLISILSEVSEVPVEMLVSGCRERDIVKPRQILCWMLRKELGMSFPAIGRAIGDRDHTTILHSCRKVELDQSLLEGAHMLREEVLWTEFERYGAS